LFLSSATYCVRSRLTKVIRLLTEAVHRSELSFVDIWSVVCFRRAVVCSLGMFFGVAVVFGLDVSFRLTIFRSFVDVLFVI